jgi:glutathionyl-hydroquinone reductase
MCLYLIELLVYLFSASIIRRSLKKLESLIGQKVAERMGKGWALTTFLREAWGSTEEEI